MNVPYPVGVSQTPKPEPSVQITGNSQAIAEQFSKATGVTGSSLNPDVFAGLNAALVPSAMETFKGLTAKSIYGDLNALSEIAKPFDAIRTIVAPQITEAFNCVIPTPAPSVAAAYAGIDMSMFDFAKTFSTAYTSTFADFANMLPRFDLPNPITAQIADAIAAFPELRLADLSRGMEAAAAEAIAVAEVEDVAVVIDDAVGAFDYATPAQLRIASLDVLMLAAAFLTVAGVLMNSGNMKGGGAALACAACLIRVYWRLMGKLD